MALDYYNEALIFAKYTPYRATKLFNIALEAKPNFAEVYYELAKLNYEKTVRYDKQDTAKMRELEPIYIEIEFNLNKAIEIDSNSIDFEAYFLQGIIFYEQRKYKKTKKSLDFFVKKSSNCDKIKIAKDFLIKVNFYFKLVNNPVNFQPKVVTGVCSEADEYLPLITPDADVMYYTRRFKTESSRPTYVEEFSFSKNLNPKDQTKDIFSEGEPMPMPFNAGLNQGGATTIDNNHLFITICEYERSGFTSYKNCDIYYTDYDSKNEQWSSLRKMNSYVNNSQSWEAQPSVTSDGRFIYFASDRKGGFGGIDIYRSEKNAKGMWMPAENLGSVINTKGDEKTPFIHTDGSTLYFSSNGNLGVGGFDIYFTKYVEDSGWIEPQNLGYPVNTQGDEVAFVVSTNGKKIYFASNQYKGEGGWDIYTSPLHEAARPTKVLLVKGHIRDAKGFPVENASVELQNTRTLKITRGMVDPNTGKYAIAVDVPSSEDDFIVTVKKRGMYFDNKYIKPSENDLNNPPKTVNFELQNIKVGTIFKLRNIYFAVNLAEFNPKSMITLNNFYEFLNLNPTIKIELLGHTDNTGTERSNKILSESRAKAVFEYLIKKGISGDRITYKGFGEEKPIASNYTKVGRAKNRRTEFIITVK